MPALRKKERDEHEAVFGPRPLPAHFGEIDLIAPFDATRFFTALRCAGYNPQVTRKDDRSLFYGFDVWRQHSVLQRQRIAAAHVWAGAKDPDGSQSAKILHQGNNDTDKPERMFHALFGLSIFHHKPLVRFSASGFLLRLDVPA